MATVYKAFDTRLEREVALKVVRRKAFPEEKIERILKRFDREAKALAKLNHANIIPIIDSGEEDGTPYLVMSLIPGGTLKERLKKKPIPWGEAARFLAPIGRALDYAHKQGIVHRDIKPSNILITKDDQPMLTDFGIARILQAEETLDLTGTGMGVGTPEYMAPEQGLGHKVDHRADIYALGIIFYEMVTGRKPFQADTPMAVVIKQINDPLPRPTQFVPDLPKEVEQILLKALAKDPNYRYQRMGELAIALDRLILEFDKANKRAEEIKKKEALKQKKQEEKIKIRQQVKSEKPASKKIPVIKIVAGAFGLLLMFSVGWLAFNQFGFDGATNLSPIFVPTGTVTSVSASSPVPSFTPKATFTFTPSPTSTDAPLLPEIVDGYDVEMVLVPEGEFRMGFGSQVSGYQIWPDGSRHGPRIEDAHAPVHSVFLDNYYIDKYEVTNSQYQECVSAASCETPTQTDSYTSSSYFGDPEHDQFPVIYVSQKMASTFCEWRNARLPTEAEWEKAARGTDERIYTWGNEPSTCDHANIARSRPCVGDTTSVGAYSKDISPYGAYDMTGNVQEWISDWFSEDYYENSPTNNPIGPEETTGKVAPRGGTWGYIRPIEFSNRLFLRGSIFSPDTTSMVIGFRCARDEIP